MHTKKNYRKLRRQLYLVGELGVQARDAHGPHGGRVGDPGGEGDDGEVIGEHGAVPAGVDGGLLDVVPSAIRTKLLIVFIVQCHCHIQHLRSEMQNWKCKSIHFCKIDSLHFLLLDAVCRGQHVLGGDDRTATEGLRPGLGENSAD